VQTATPPGLSPYAVVAQNTGIETFLGDDLLAWLLLAIGGALAIGTLLALVRPPANDSGGSDGPERPPLARSLVMITIGLVAAVWGAASLLG
jgi:hypothetical protein